MPSVLAASEIRSYPDTVGPDEANDGDFGSSWYLDERQTSGWLELDLRKQESLNVVSLVKPVGRWGDYPQSRIRNFCFQRWNGARWITCDRWRNTRTDDNSSHSARLIAESPATVGGDQRDAPRCRDWRV
jgi:hypothetical protein